MSDNFLIYIPPGGEGGSQDLQAVLSIGNTADTSILLTNNYDITLDPSTGTIASESPDESIIILPQQIQIVNDGFTLGLSSTPSAARAQTFQDDDGVIALEETMTLQKVTDAGNTTTDTIFIKTGSHIDIELKNGADGNRHVGLFSADNSSVIVSAHDSTPPRVEFSTADAEVYLELPLTNENTVTVSLPDETGILLTDAQKGVANGLATLDGSTKVPLEQLPYSTLIYKGTWVPGTNTPSLADGVGTAGDFYLVEVDGTHDWGAPHGSVSYVAGNGVVYDGSEWQKVGSVVSGGVISVSSANTSRITVADGTGNAVLDVVSAPKLQTARNINYVSFDGQADILLNNTYKTLSDAAYTLILTDNQKILLAPFSTGRNITIPTNASVAFPTGTRIDIVQTGAGKVTIAPVSGAVTINSYNGNKAIAGQYVAVSLLKTGTDTWLLIGNLIA